MTMTKKLATDIDAADLSQELDDILSKLQAEDINVDTALELYQRGITVTEQLETYLKTAENKITKLKVDLEAK